MTLLSLLLPLFMYLSFKMITNSNSDLAVPLNSEE